ncbi:DUF7523 family protein [Halodesulfurarchaeum sp.]|uniref:DUF7523 family protein n=1 Tax=Halodesulfurarchaeum sp. TaxID=1980530 RepID=UPI001BC7BB82|nr:hypothetical protein [Halodesulfurarchaeum sp.]
MSSIAAETRRAVDTMPYLRYALRAGVVNYTEAARQLDIAAETGAVASALRRYAAELPPLETSERTVRVRMEREVSAADTDISAVGQEATDRTIITLEGEIDAGRFGRVLSALGPTGVTVRGAEFASETGSVLVDQGDGSTALRSVEAVLDEPT